MKNPIGVQDFQPNGGVVPVGGIIMWCGAVADIPTNWHLCNGSHGTPDLRDKFIVGATSDDSGVAKTNATGSLTQSGGAATHAHNLPFNIGTGALGIFAGTLYGNDGTATARTYKIDHSGDTTKVPHALTATGSSLPPYFALCFIQRMQ